MYWLEALKGFNLYICCTNSIFNKFTNSPYLIKKCW